MSVDLAGLALGSCLDVLGRPVEYRPAGGAAFVARGIFTAAHEVVRLMDGDAPVSSTAPVLGVRLADFAAPPEAGDVVVVGGREYRVEDVQPDGEGGARLVLHGAGS